MTELLERDKAFEKYINTPKGKGLLMQGERELTTGLLSKDAGFRLIVNGTIGVKEIEMLIKKLTLDKEILADTGSAEETDNDRL